VKFLLLAALFFSPSAGFACKPGPLPTCNDPPLALKAESFAKLVAAVGEFQSELNRTIQMNDQSGSHEKIPAKESMGRTSCFNNHFAQIYLDQLGAFAQSHKNKICELHPGWVAAQVKDLIDEKSAEWQAIKIGREKLQAKAKAVNTALTNFLPAGKTN